MPTQVDLKFDAEEAMARINSSKSQSVSKLRSGLKKQPNKNKRRRVMTAFEDQATRIVLSDREHGDEMFGGRDFSQFDATNWDTLFDLLGPFLKLLLSLLL